MVPPAAWMEFGVAKRWGQPDMGATSENGNGWRERRHLFGKSAFSQAANSNGWLNPQYGAPLSLVVTPRERPVATS